MTTGKVAAAVAVSLDEVKRRGLDQFRDSILEIAPFLAERVCELRDWDQVKLLTVKLNRLRRWYRPGLLCIGDAAHAMSPAGGVGINLAIQDAVAAARFLARPLLDGRVSEEVLASLQRRREFPTRVTQFIQSGIHAGFARVFQNPGPTGDRHFDRLFSQRDEPLRPVERAGDSPAPQF